MSAEFAVILVAVTKANYIRKDVSRTGCFPVGDMNSSSTQVVPPAPQVHAKDLPTWQLLLQFTRNSISTIPDYAFDRLVSRRRVLGIDSLMMNDPEGVRHVLGAAMEKYKRLVSTRRVRVWAAKACSRGRCRWRRQLRLLAPVFAGQR